MKRGLDLIISLISLILLSPILFFTCFSLKILVKTDIFFFQERSGLNGKPFILYKFKTMKDLTDSNGNPLGDNKRTTKFGRWLRDTSIDELPSLINIIKNDMSLVGPRPLLIEYVPLYSKEQFSRHNVKPGVTGWAQINGRNEIDWEKKFELDIWYVQNQSFLLDLKILFLTFLKVIKREGINNSEKITMPPFKGSI